MLESRFDAIQYIYVLEVFVTIDGDGHWSGSEVISFGFQLPKNGVNVFHAWNVWQVIEKNS